MFCKAHSTTKLVYKRWGSCFEWKCPECESASGYEPLAPAAATDEHIDGVMKKMRDEAGAKIRAICEGGKR